MQIEKPESRHHTERLWNNPAPEISVRYRNLDQVHFRIIPIDYMDRLKKVNGIMSIFIMMTGLGYCSKSL